ncbi:hypothetical protein HanRHA438_Chr16g0758441 [Helianthus annuus]|nr:hypothetical protein HanRHA438_Chr16g0758441 [Helianthus annuus]
MFICMEIYNMIFSGIIRVNGPGIGRVSLNPIPVPMPEFFPYLNPYPTHTHRASGIPCPYVSSFRFTRRVWGFFAIPSHFQPLVVSLY